MFSRWGTFVYRHRRIVLVLALALGVAAASVAGRATGVLSAGGYLDPRSESQAVTDRLAAEFGQGRGTLILLYLGPAGADATSAAFQAEVRASVAGLRSDPDVIAVTGYAETGNRRFVSTDGTAAYVVASLTVTDEASVPLIDGIESHIAKPGAGIRLLESGYAPFARDMAAQSEQDLTRAERLSLPIAALVLLLVFGSLVAAAMPLLVAGLAIPSTLALVWLVGQQVQLSIYVQNVSTMLGLALAIDYSLFIVSRFREELHRGRTTGDAVSIAVATSGKAVTFSGMAVAAGLAGLLAFASPALRSFGIGGALTVLASLVYALTFLPALLGMIGPRIDALSVAGLRAGLRRSTGRAPATPGASRWARVANAVMRHPVAVLVPTLAILLAAGTPFLHLEQGLPGAATLPAAVQSREAADALTNRFEAGTTMPIVVLVDAPGDPASGGNVRALAAYAARLAGVDGIGRVEGPFDGIANPATGQALTVDQLVGLYGQPRPAWPTALGALWDRYVHGSTVRMDAISPITASTPEGAAVIPLVRAVDPGPGFRSQVGGFAAVGYDFLESQATTTPVSVAIVLVAMAVIVYLLFGSAVLPFKAVVMTLLSITASFGSLIWIFQDGHLSDVLRFTSPGFTMAGVPVIMFCVIFGLSMDYEVLLLSRVQEAWRRTGDNTASVAEGLARTAGVITGAAAIMISVFVAFSLAESLTIKSIGVGMAVAVFVDATIVRVLLVPATMRLLGRWNWWAPGPLARFADRLGFSHVEDEAAALSPTAD
jgi:putative drug exporter of the RND superfamily